MNLDVFAVLFLAFMIFAVTVTALMFYVRHWASREAQRSSSAQITEGRFLKRYIPPPLRARYDEERTRQTHRKSFSRRTVARLLNIAIGGVALLIAGGSLDINRARLLAPIDLTPQEIMGLRVQEASWSASPAHDVPGMEQRLSLLRKHGIAIIASETDHEQVIQGRRLTAMAKVHWQHFFNRWNISYRQCGWYRLSDCLNGRIGIVLPGNWQLAELDRALEDGANLILYGPPTSVLTEHRPVQWAGLLFEPFSNGSIRHMALRGDQLLTLGFDAGLILEADHAFKGYRVFSDSPQAIGMSTDHKAGGVVDTRLYAKGIGRGRLVWMDYAPDSIDQAISIDVGYLEAITAAIFRYLLGETYSSWAMWPDGKRFAGMISEDSEDKFHYAERVIELVEANGFPITWFILSNEAQLNRGLTQRMAEVGEVACHGDSHASFPLGNLLTQTERLARCAKVIKTITGLTPGGFRPPEERFNGDTINAVASLNMSYYFADAGIDRAVPVLLREEGGNRELISLPRMGTDDYEMWHILKLNGKESLQYAESDLKWISAVGGFLPFDFHTQYMDKKEHLAVVEHYGRRFLQEDCFFGTASQIADWWRIRTLLGNGEAVPSEALSQFRPVLLKVNDQGQLTREYAKSS